jgi:hypothetical protein
MRFTVIRMIIAIAAFAVLLVVERFLFNAAFRAIPSPYHPTGHVVTAETYLLWMFFNAVAAAVLVPMIYAMKIAGCFPSTSRPGGAWLRRLATALSFGFGGALIGVVLGLVVGLPAGYAMDPSSSNPHNYGGILRGFVTVTIAVIGGYFGLVVGLVQYSRRVRSKSLPGDRAGDLA